jgi:hypothetical protein
MSAAALRVMQLCRLAVDPAAAPGESRNAAIAACRLIVSKPDVLALAQSTPPAADPIAWRIFRSKFAGFCQQCASWFREGETIAWAKGQGALCLACHRRGTT